MINSLKKSTTLRLTYFILIIPLLCTFIWMLLPGLAASAPNPCIPSVETNPATNITTNTATLNGNLTSLGICFQGQAPQNGFGPSTNVFFYWGLTQGGPYPNMTSSQTKTETGPFSAAIQSLSPCTAYYFVAAAMLPLGTQRNVPNFNVYAFISEVTGAERSFRTTCNAPTETKKMFIDTVSPSVGNPPNVNVRSLSVQQPIYTANQPVTIYAKVMNTGDVTGGYTAVLKINGIVEQTKTGTVSGQAAQPLQFTVYKDKPGTYQVEINGQITSFTVVGHSQQTSNVSGQQPIFISIMCIAVVILILLAIVVMRRRHI